MSRLFAIAAGVFLLALVGGTGLYVVTRPAGDCGVDAVAGAAIGGPFTLTDQTGRVVTDADVIDRPALVYFGYTWCPDVCPFDVARNAAAVDILAEDGIDVRPVFISIDPARDTPEVLGEYVEAMHPGMIALTGTAEEVRTAATAYKVYYAKGPGEGDDYLMDHSTFTYLMLPGTGLATYFNRDATAERIAEVTACLAG